MVERCAIASAGELATVLERPSKVERSLGSRDWLSGLSSVASR